MAQNYSGKFVADMIRCFNNKQGYLSLEFDDREVFEICVGPEMTFNEGKVLRIDNSGNNATAEKPYGTLQVFYGTIELPRLTNRFEMTRQQNGTEYPAKPTPGFFLANSRNVQIDRLERSHLYQLLGMKGCVESGDFFIELYDAPTVHVKVVETVK